MVTGVTRSRACNLAIIGPCGAFRNRAVHLKLILEWALIAAIGVSISQAATGQDIGLACAHRFGTVHKVGQNAAISVWGFSTGASGALTSRAESDQRLK